MNTKTNLKFRWIISVVLLAVLAGSVWATRTYDDGEVVPSTVFDPYFPSTVVYCTASGGGYYEYISGVEVGQISNTGTGRDGYADYTSLSTTMGIGTGYVITVTNG